MVDKIALSSSLIDHSLGKRLISLKFKHENIICVFDTYTGHVMNIKWDYGYYQPWSDNGWLVDEMLALLDKDITMQ